MSAENEIRALLEERARAFHAKDPEAVAEYYTEDVVNFDLAPPLAQRGYEARNPAVLNEWFDSWDGPIEMTFERLQILSEGDLAFAFGFLHMTGRRTDGSYTDVWARVTAGFAREGKRWRIVHEHQSFPTKMDGSGLSASDLKP